MDMAVVSNRRYRVDAEVTQPEARRSSGAQRSQQELRNNWKG